MASLGLCKQLSRRSTFLSRCQSNFATRRSSPLDEERQIQEGIKDGVARRNLSKILIANRGEIACRIIRTARKMGISTVAVYSDPDKESLHVDMADEAFRIGPASTNESYLNEKKIIQAALTSGAHGIHPGYGFLSQSPEFAQLCADNGVTFIGPSPRAISDMGIKSTSKTLMEKAGVPIIQGYHGDDQSVGRLKAEAKKIGFPIMIKAFRGGGGKGMRVAMNEAEFEQQLDSAKRESMKSFGDDAMLVEKYVQRPRHVEVQVFGDHHGNYVYLFERDCSVQRRHQKIIEEAPAPGISEETRRSIGEAAVRAAQAVDYVGAGTVEFILDSDRHEFFFMEMNTRLQVEHPVTEMITGTDLVAWQLKVAAGERLPLLQNDLRIRGHSFEARVYAENPEDNFMPGAGPLTHLSLDFDPASFDGTVRVETGVRQGDQVSVHYDPMIAKLVVWGEDRSSALRKLRSVLTGYHISGLSTNINFLTSLCDNASFQSAHVHTDFIKEHITELFPAKGPPTPEALVQAAVALHFLKILPVDGGAALFADPFDSVKNWRMNYSFAETTQLSANGKVYDVALTSTGDGKFRVQCLGKELVVEVSTDVNDGMLVTHACIDGRMLKSKSVMEDSKLHLFQQDGCVTFEVPALKYESLLATKETGADEARAPMPGVIEKIMVQPGQEVKQGDPLVVMIAMKMEYVIKAPKSGIIKKVAFKTGVNVPKGSQLVYYEEPTSS
ncbi:Methylcrotonoyl-CoA carboxylase subunit alpha, mitochondrial [Hypsibius exemplaris]|uniref:Methylcrotonoyl-CoA carboxylase subunit alpha, mitochondrial n=1 Tax=Hypsibius exemplaris TaxID=2072580 RepID=A0A9X6NGA5_HYPEX|nr:Methylcrotonoyl-CoA carboxylase subunit alpha, mitochondrial [Hypsibius exemplaris]